MGVAALFARRRMVLIFMAGWIPVVLLALVGTALELNGTTTCPKTTSGTPLCFYSLAAAFTLFALYFATLFLLKKENGSF